MVEAHNAVPRYSRIARQDVAGDCNRKVSIFLVRSEVRQCPQHPVLERVICHSFTCRLVFVVLPIFCLRFVALPGLGHALPHEPALKCRRFRRWWRRRAVWSRSQGWPLSHAAVFPRLASLTPGAAPTAVGRPTIGRSIVVTFTPQSISSLGDPGQLAILRFLQSRIPISLPSQLWFASEAHLVEILVLREYRIEIHVVRGIDPVQRDIGLSLDLLNSVDVSQVQEEPRTQHDQISPSINCLFLFM
mmetsp:Transcript_130391/g.237130  ORF Transcript_130391/g.237130 Transcript_130391/m.237130 type:complete len:246 (+) Transcript_130391:996-1733(+)